MDVDSGNIYANISSTGINTIRIEMQNNKQIQLRGGSNQDPFLLYTKRHAQEINNTSKNNNNISDFPPEKWTLHTVEVDYGGVQTETVYAEEDENNAGFSLFLQTWLTN